MPHLNTSMEAVSPNKENAALPYESIARQPLDQEDRGGVTLRKREHDGREFGKVGSNTAEHPPIGYSQHPSGNLHLNQVSLGKSVNFDRNVPRESLTIGGIHWAPLNIGLERRLQTLVVLWHTLTIAIFLTSFFFTCAIPLSWPLLLPYLIYITLFSTAATSGTLSGRSNFLRSLPVWSLYASYFPARLHRSEPLLPTRKYIFGYHPHGIISHGAFAAFCTEALGFSKLFPGLTNTLLTLDSNFRIPFYREYALAMGLASVSRESCENLLSKGGMDGEGMGRAITIVIGGARESLNALPHSLRLVLKRRKGFIKLAIRTGADLVPVLAFGENDLYEQVHSDRHPLIHKFQMLVKHTMGFTIPLFHARGVFNYDVGLMPYRRPLNIVVGRPIQVVQQQDRDKIDDAYINQLHSTYVRELERLWEEWKDVFAKDRTSNIEIVA